MPPEWMWPFADEIADWFEEVRIEKENNADSDESVELVKNDDPRLRAARELRG